MITLVPSLDENYSNGTGLPQDPSAPPGRPLGGLDPDQFHCKNPPVEGRKGFNEPINKGDIH